MPSFALKAALADYAQLDARASFLDRSRRPVRLELHTFGARDLDSPTGLSTARANIARLTDSYFVASLVVHVPVQSVALVTTTDFDAGQCERAIAFAQEIGAEAVVLHRYFGLVAGDAAPRVASRAEAADAFNDILRGLARGAGGVRLLVENIGHYWILPRGQAYLSGPLDHFFPWEIVAFREFLRREHLAGVEPFVDIAHATLSANMFNRRRRQPGLTARDPRFAWITEDDLQRAERLTPLDFVEAAMPYLHVSDALFLAEADCRRADLPEATLTDAITREGLEIGAGNLPFAHLPPRVGTAANLVLEVEPGPDETHVSNGAQLRSLERLERLFAP